MSSSDSRSPNEGDPSHLAHTCAKAATGPLPSKNDGVDLHYFRLLQNKEARVKELEDELKDAKKTISLLSETVRNLSFTRNESDTQEAPHNGQNHKLEERLERLEEMINKMNEAMQTELILFQKTMKYAEDNEKEMRRNVEELSTRMEIIEKKVFLADSKKWNKMHETLGGNSQFMKEEAFQKKVDSLLNGDLDVLKKRIKTKNSEIVFENGSSFNFEDFEKIIQTYREKAQGNRKFQHALAVLQNPLWILTPDNYELKCFSCDEMVPLASVYEGSDISAKCSNFMCTTWTCLGKAKDGLEWVYAPLCHHFQQVEKDKKPNNCLVCGENAPEFEGDFYHKQVGTPVRKEF